jgi:mannose-6-phosphate isomerase-like protein (cupin superfamily)
VEHSTWDTSHPADVMAFDGSEVRLLSGTARAGAAHFSLLPGHTSRAACHRTVDELWFVVAGEGEMWRRHGDDQSVIHLSAGTSIAIPVGTAFQFRATGSQALGVLAATIPPWPGDDEVFGVDGPWVPGTT